MKKERLKVQKGWEDNGVPHYEFISKINILAMDEGCILKLSDSIPLTKKGKFWYYTYNHCGMVLDSNTVYWLEDKPIVIILQSKNPIVK